MNKKTILLLLCISILSLFFNAYKQQVDPPCINADEAAFNYNAYSILKTGRDEYGTLMPMRLKSFGDFKMPLYTYLTVPVLGVMGLHDSSARMLNNIIALAFPIAVYFLAKELFGKDRPSLISAALVAVSLGLHIVGRHAHEAYLTAFLITLTSVFFVRSLKRGSTWSYALTAVFLMASLFSYQSSRIFAVFFIAAAVVYGAVRRTQFKRVFGMAALLVLVLAIFSVSDIIYKPERVKNLLFFSNGGFASKIDELRGEGGPAILYNKAVLGLRDLAMEHATYFSPQFLAISGDTNKRFGFPQMAPVTLIEYAFMLIGIYYLFRNKEKWRYFLILLLLISPLSASLSWQTTSLTRSLFLLVPVLILSAYGMASMCDDIHPAWRRGLIGAGIAAFLFFFLFSWDFYLNHYPKRTLVQQSWQCGYKGLSEYVKQHYDTTDQFYITRKNGEPYIMLLYYLAFPPEKYQRQATLTTPDEYGFGQVEQFDKFRFDFTIPHDGKRNVVVGYPDDFNGTGISESQVEKIRVGTWDVFWMYRL